MGCAGVYAGSHRGLVADIHADRECPDAQLSSQVMGRLFILVCEYHPRTFGHEALRVCRTDAASRTGDQRYIILQFLHWILFPCCCFTTWRSEEHTSELPSLM